MDSATLLIEALGWTLVHFLWEGAVLAAGLWVVLRGMRRAAAVWRYAAAALVMGVMLAAAVATLVWNWPAEAERRVIPRAGGPQGVAVAPRTESDVVPSPVSGPGAPVDQGVGAEAPWSPVVEAPSGVVEPEGLAIRPWFPWMVGAWAVGVLVVLARLGHGWWWLRRVRLGSVAAGAGRWNERFLEIARVMRVSRPVRLLSSATARVPMVVGWLKPVVIVPAALFAGLPAAQFEAILAHELAHIRRNDFLVNLLQCLVEALFFYHPAVWWVSGQVRKEREHCCDDIASGLCGGALPYAKALTALEEFRGTEASLGLAASGRPLLQRIRRLLGVRESATLGWPAAATLIALALLPLGLVLGSAKPAFVAPQAAHIGDGVWSSYCVHAGGETQFVFLTKGDFSSSTRSHHNPVARTWENDGTLRFPDGREVNFRRSHEKPDTLVVEDSLPAARFHWDAATTTETNAESSEGAGFQPGFSMSLPLFGLGPEQVKVEGDRITYTFSLSRGRVLLLDEVAPGIHQMKLPVQPITSAESLAAACSLVESASTANAAAHPGMWVFPGGVTLRLYGEVFHATDVMTTALISWPATDGREAGQWHTGIAGDAFANREKWVVGWEKAKPVLWVASRSLESAEQAPDGRPVANRFKRINFSDPSHIREEYFQGGWLDADGPPASVVTQMAAFLEVRAGGKAASTLHSWASAGAAEKIDLSAVQHMHLTVSQDGATTVEVQELKQTSRPEAVAETLAALRAEWTAKRGAALAGKSMMPRVTVSLPPGAAPAALEGIRAACVEAGCGPMAAGSVRGTGGARRFESGAYHGVVLDAVGAAPIFIVAPKAFDLSADANALQGRLTFPVATSAKELRLRYGWDPARPTWLTLRNHDFEEQINDLSRGRIFWVTFDRHEFNAALYQVPGEAGTGTDEASLAAVVARAQAWWDKADERARWEQSRVVVPDSGCYAGKPLDASADTIVWGKPNEAGLRLGLGGLKPGASVPAGQPLPVKQYIRNDGPETIRLSATGPFNEGIEGSLRRADGARIPHLAKYQWPMVAIRARLEPGHYIELQSRPQQTVYANPDGSASGALLGYDSGFIVKPGDYLLELTHHIGRFHGAPANTFTGNPSIAPGLGEWTGVLYAAPLQVQLTEPAVGTARPGDVREDRGLDRIQFKPDRLILSHPAPGKTGSHSYIVGADGNWPTAAGEWPIARPDDGYLAAWDEGNRRLWILNGPTVQKLDLTGGTLRDAGSWPASTPADGYGDMPPGVREALGVPRAESASAPADQSPPSGLKIVKIKSTQLAFGPPRADGLRVAWALSPPRDAYQVGEIVKGAVWFYNDGPAAVTFTTDAWHQFDTWKATRADGSKVEVRTTWFTGTTPQETITLEPGETREIPAHGVGIGNAEFAERYGQAELGAELWADPGDEVTCVWEVAVSPSSAERLTTGPVTFRVTAAPPEGPKPPIVTDRLGSYNLGRGAILNLSQIGSAEGYTNYAWITWEKARGAASDGKADIAMPRAADPKDFSLPTFVISRSVPALWIVEDENIRKLDFSTLGEAKEISWPRSEAPADFGGAPEDVQEAMRREIEAATAASKSRPADADGLPLVTVETSTTEKPAPDSRTQLATGLYIAVSAKDPTAVMLSMPGPAGEQSIAVAPEVTVPKDGIEAATAAEESDGSWVVRLRLSEAAATQLAAALKANPPPGSVRNGAPAPKHRIALVIDGSLVAAPEINGEVGTELQLSGNFTEVAAKRLAEALVAAHENKGGDTAGEQKDAPQSLPTETPAAANDLSEKEAVRLATEAAVGFFKTDDLSSRLQALDVADEERDAVAAFLQRHPLPADPGAMVIEAPSGEPDFVSASRRPDGGWMVKVAIELPQSGQIHFFFVHVTGREARLHWESSTMRQAGLFEAIAKGQAGDTHTIWATVKRGDYFNRAYFDETRFSCYELSVPRVDRRFFGYATKGSLLDQALVAALGPGETSLTMPLVITVPQADRDERQFEIVAAPEAEAAYRSIDAAPPVAGFAIRLVSDEAGPTNERLPERTESGEVVRFLHVEKDVVISSTDLASAAAEAPPPGESDWRILVELAPEAGQRFEEFTGRHFGRRLAIVVDGVVLMAPTIRDRIGRSIAISGTFNEAEAKRLVQTIRPPGDGEAAPAPREKSSQPDAPEAGAPAHRLRVVASPDGSAIPHFRVLAGVPSGVSSEFEKARNVEVITWQPHTLREGANGELLWPLERSYEKMALRVEADGFVPQVFSWLEQAKGARELTIQMVADAGVRGTVMTPENRRPAHDATVILAMIGRSARLQGATRPELQINPNPASLREAWERPVVVTPGSDGSFTLPTEIDPTAMVLFLHGDGVLEMPYAVWKAQPDVTLERWGRIHGRVKWGDIAGRGEKVSLSANHGDAYGYPDILSQSDETVASEEGVFVFQRVLPGLCQLSCPIIPEPGNAAGFTAINLDGRLTHATVVTGPTITPVVIGGVGRTVKGRLIGRASYDGVTLRFHPTAPHIGLPGDDEIWKAWSAFRTSAQGHHFFREGLPVAADGTFEIPAVLPGSYQMFFEMPGPDSNVAFSALNVPSEHRDHAPEPMDLGEIKARP